MSTECPVWNCNTTVRAIKYCPSVDTLSYGVKPDIPLAPERPVPEHPWDDEPEIDEPYLPEDPGEIPEDPDDEEELHAAARKVNEFPLTLPRTDRRRLA